MQRDQRGYIGLRQPCCIPNKLLWQSADLGSIMGVPLGVGFRVDLVSRSMPLLGPNSCIPWSADFRSTPLQHDQLGYIGVEQPCCVTNQL